MCGTRDIRVSTVNVRESSADSTRLQLERRQRRPGESQLAEVTSSVALGVSIFDDLDCRTCTSAPKTSCCSRTQTLTIRCSITALGRELEREGPRVWTWLRICPDCLNQCSDAAPESVPHAPSERAFSPVLGNGAPGWTRTSGHQLRRLVLYPTELRAPCVYGTPNAAPLMHPRIRRSVTAARFRPYFRSLNRGPLS